MSEHTGSHPEADQPPDNNPERGVIGRAQNLLERVGAMALLTITPDAIRTADNAQSDLIESPAPRIRDVATELLTPENLNQSGVLTASMVALQALRLVRQRRIGQ